MYPNDPREDDRDERPPARSGPDPDEERESWTRFEDSSNNFVKVPEAEIGERRRDDADM
jgi:hypothetical protein